MPAKKTKLESHLVYHKDGSLWAKGSRANGVCVGYWEWFRKDGTRMRSGHFENGQQSGEWITYDTKGQKYKVTHIKPPQAPKASQPGATEGDPIIQAKGMERASPRAKQVRERRLGNRK